MRLEIFINHPLILVDFYADWCEPCKMLDEILIEVKEKLCDNVHIQKIDVDAETDIAKEYSVMSVPVLILFKNGEPVWRMNGFLMAPDLIKTLEKFL